MSDTPDENEPHANNGNSATTETESFVDKAIDAAKNVEIGPIFAITLKVMFAIYETTSMVWQKAKPYIEYLPSNAIKATYGISLCFFGGMFGNAIAALEAFASGGGRNFTAATADLHEQFKKVYASSINDESKREDDPSDEQRRKMLIFIREVDPNKTMMALGSLFTASMSMLMVVQFKFAKALALANSIANAVAEPVSIFLINKANNRIPEEYHKWGEFSISLIMKGIIIGITTTSASVLNSVQSAIRGGTMFGRAVVKEAHRRGLLEEGSNTNLHQLIGWSVAMVGIYFQVFNYFQVPFPFNIILFPLSMLEYSLTSVLTWMSFW